MPAPHTVDWSALSPAARETASLVGLRLTAGWSIEEILPELNRHPERFRFNTLPRPGVVTKGWVQGRLRALRREIEETLERVLSYSPPNSASMAASRRSAISTLTEKRCPHVRHSSRAVRAR